MSKIVSIFGDNLDIITLCTHQCAKLGYNVIIFNVSKKDEAFLKMMNFPGKITIYRGDVLDYTATTSVIQVSDIVINAALREDNKIMNILGEYCEKYNIGKYINIVYQKDNIKFDKFHVSTEYLSSVFILNIGNIISVNSEYINAISQYMHLPVVFLPNFYKYNFISFTELSDIGVALKNILNDKSDNNIFVITSVIDGQSLIDCIQESLSLDTKVFFIPVGISNLIYKFLNIIPSQFLKFISALFCDISTKNKNLNSIKDAKLLINSYLIGKSNDGVYNENMNIKNYY